MCSLVHTKSLRLESARVLHEDPHVSALMNENETMEKEGSSIRDIQMDNLRSSLGMKGIYRILNV